MIEQIKVLIEEWNWEGISEKLDTQEEREAITELVSSCRYLIGEVEQVHEDKKNMLANWNAALKRADRAETKVRELQKALEYIADVDNPFENLTLYAEKAIERSKSQ